MSEFYFEFSSEENPPKFLLYILKGVKEERLSLEEAQEMISEFTKLITEKLIAEVIGDGGEGRRCH